MTRLSKMDYPAYYETYISQVDQTNSVVDNLKDSNKEAIEFLKSIVSAKEDFAYADGKWTVKEVLQHCIDTERIFNMRALCFARKDQTPLPGFDENKYANQANCSLRNFGQMIKEFEALRSSSIFLFESLSEEALAQKGVASNNEISVRAIGYILTGHMRHHMAIIKERYL